MSIFKKKQISESVGGDIFSDGGDRNVVNNSEIETGPVDKPYNDDSDYEKGMATTTDRVFGRYRQNIPWFAVYSFGGSRSGLPIRENNKKTVTKKSVEEIIEDLVKKGKNNDVTDKNYDSKLEKIIDTIKDSNLTDAQVEEILKALESKKDKPKTI